MTCAHDSSLDPRAFSRRVQGLIPVAIKTLALMFVTAGLFHSASASVTPYMSSLAITDDAGNSWSLNLGSLLSYNSSTGDITMPAAGSPLTGNWSWAKVGVVDNTGAVTQKDGLQWHTNEQTNGNWDSVITFYSTGSTDPLLSYGFSARNTTGSVQNYAFTYGESIIPPVSGSYSLYSDIAGSVTNAVNGTPAKITPTTADQDSDGVPEIQALKFSTDGGATLFDAGTDVGPAFQTGPGVGTSSYGVYSSTLTGSAGAPINYWQFETRFSLTPGKDAAAISGFADLETIIPEPSTYAALLAALAFGAVAMRRNRPPGSITL